MGKHAGSGPAPGSDVVFGAIYRFPMFRRPLRLYIRDIAVFLTDTSFRHSELISWRDYQLQQTVLPISSDY